MLRPAFLLALFLLLVLSVPSIAKAPEGPKSLGTFGGWLTYVSTEGGEKVCYMTLRVKGISTKKFKRSDGWLMVTERPAENSRDVVSYNGGYNFKPVSDLTVKIGKDDFSLFTQKDTAWSRDSATDRQITADLRKEGEMTATGIPAAKGAVPITDKIALTGAEKAYLAIAKGCGMEVTPLAKPASAKAKASKPPQR